MTSFKVTNTTHLVCLLLPLLVVAIGGYFIIEDIELLLKEIAAFSLMTLLVYCVLAFFTNSKLGKAATLASYAFLAFFAFTKLSFYMQYGVGISASALFVIFETNREEASDYLSNYFNRGTFIVLLLLLLPFLFLLKKKWNFTQHQTKSSISRKIVRSGFLLLIAMGSLFIIRKTFATQNIPYATVTTWNEYKIAKQQLKDALAQPISTVFKDVTASEDTQTYVVVIGESTSKWHMQLYGYQRETNPKLSAIREELLVMDSIITPHVHTITALEKILTLADVKDPKPASNGSIIQLANQAGFTTYWLSNQKPVGIYESIPTILGSAAQHTKFIATDNYNYNIYDGELLPELDAILADKTTTKKVIFMHLIGTHLRYEKRYPEAFNVFTEAAPFLKYNHDKAVTQTNTYDNSVRYNDYVIHEIIKMLQKEDGRSYMTYFSDHGDEVYDTMDFLGHNEYHGTRPMHEVPLLFWFSDAYKANSFQNWKAYQGRKYSLEHFPHTFAQLSGIHFNSFNASKSVLDSTFIDRPRIIKETIDYDQQ